LVYNQMNMLEKSGGGRGKKTGWFNKVRFTNILKKIKKTQEGLVEEKNLGGKGKMKGRVKRKPEGNFIRRVHACVVRLNSKADIGEGRGETKGRSLGELQVKNETWDVWTLSFCRQKRGVPTSY